MRGDWGFTDSEPRPTSSPKLRGIRGERCFAFTRQGDEVGQDFARELGASWAGDSTVAPPEPLDAALIFAPVGSLVPQALSATAKGGTVVCAGIHMSDIPSFPYRLLWEERTVRSVANSCAATEKNSRARPPSADPHGGPNLPALRCQPGTHQSSIGQNPRRCCAAALNPPTDDLPRRTQRTRRGKIVVSIYENKKI